MRLFLMHLQSQKSFQDFEMDFEIKEQEQEGDLTINGIKSLLEIVFINLFKNVCLYSYEPKAKVEISETLQNIEVKITNEGEVISEEEAAKILKHSEEEKFSKYFWFRIRS
jgi:K+-sensing histidine kinase KdpD